MTRSNTMYGNRQRTQRDHFNDALAFICNARSAALLAMTAERLCQDKGLSNRQMRREVEERLLAAQGRERTRDS